MKKLLYFPIGLVFVGTAPVWLPLALLALVLISIYYCGQEIFESGEGVYKGKYSGDL